MPEVVTIEAFGRSYRINNPGEGRVASKLNNGEPYERKLLVDTHQLGVTGTVFDVGAHVGNHTLYYAAICGLKVHAWEPFEDSRRQLEANLALNPGLDVTVHPWAAGAETGRGRISGEMTIQLDRGDIPVYRIDDHLAVDDLAVVKVDVEGMEPHALTGMLGHLERCSPVIYTECHSRAAHAAVAEVLEPLDYQVDKTIQMGSTMERWRRG